MLDVIFILLGLLILLGFIRVLIRDKRPVRKAILSMLSGAGALGFASLFAALFGTVVTVNIYTVFIALTLGIPGVVLIILKMFLI